MTNNSLAMVQIPLEMDMQDLGKARFHKLQDTLKAQGLLTQAQTKVLSGALPLVSQRIRDDADAANNEGRGKTAQWVLPLSVLDTDVVAFVGLNQCFYAVAKNHDVRKLTKHIGQFLNMEVWSVDLKQANPKLYERILKNAQKHTSYKYKKNASTAIAGKAGFTFERWDDEFCLRVGAAVLNAILGSCNLFEMYEKPEGRHNVKKMLGLTPEALTIIKDMDEAAQWMTPYFKPMSVPPRKWDAYNTGCYYDENLAYHVPLVRTYDRKHQKLIKDRIADGSMNGVLYALNSIQEVPLKINTIVYDLVKHCWEKGISFGKLPTKQGLPVPTVPLDWFTLTQDEKTLWKRKKEKVILRNRAIEADILNMAQDLATAKEYIGMGTFYLPHSLDFRGRVYPVPVFNHQRADHIRSMFEFATGKPLGEDGAYWLAIQIANSGDFQKISKKSFAERHEWVLAHSAWIKEIGDNPYDTVDEWACADKPFAFLAGCVEWAAYCKHGNEYVSHIPIALDGSNSGLQHYSAALRDEVGGATVNLKSTPVPQDVYQAVADVVEMEVQAELPNPLAQLWLDYGISRKVVKRCVMTFPYSSEQFGFRQHLIEDLMKPMEDQVLGGHLPSHPFGDDNGRAAATYLAAKIWTAVNEVVSKAAEGMRFLQKCAQVMAHEGKPLQWTTPIGFPVLHKYEEWDVKRVAMFLHDRAVSIREATSSDKVTERGEVLKKVVSNLRTKPKGRILKDRQKNAVAPNFIHSLDSSHLLLTTLDARAAGIDDFLLIHDSFSTYACDTRQYQGIITSAFVDMYQNNDVFDTFYQYVAESLENVQKLPTPPAKGNLDLNETLTSTYAFS